MDVPNGQPKLDYQALKKGENANILSLSQALALEERWECKHVKSFPGAGSCHLPSQLVAILDCCLETLNPYTWTIMGKSACFLSVQKS